MVSPGSDQPLADLRERLGKRAERRTSRWADRQTAYKSLKQTTHWDKRVIKAFVVCVEGWKLDAR